MHNTNKTHRIAAASTDGKTINEHFGKAAVFLIYEIGKKGYTFIEERKVTPLSCESGHTEDGILSTLDTLKDCTAVIAVKVGGSVKRAFEINGISVFEAPGSIDNALDKLTAYYTNNYGGKHEDGI